MEDIQFESNKENTVPDNGNSEKVPEQKSNIDAETIEIVENVFKSADRLPVKTMQSHDSGKNLYKTADGRLKESLDTKRMSS